MGLFVPQRLAPPSSMKAGPLGQGSGVLLTEFPLITGLSRQSPQKKMQRAWQLGIEVPWIRRAEMVIAAEFVGVPWHLEDEAEETIDDTASGSALDAYNIIAKPQMNLSTGQRLTRSDLWRLTCRHMGLTGNAFWYLDSLNAFGQPASIIYLRPDRMTPVEDSAGNLTGWLIDKTQTDPGIGVRLDQVIHFMLEPPDIGHFGIGLVESALLKIQLSTKLDQHLGMVLDAGGRLSGIMAPKQGLLEGEQMLQLERDWRNVVEQSDAAKRLQLVRAPVDFTPTTLSPAELQIRDLMTGARDDLLGLWGVPLSKLGVHDRAKGLGASTVVEEDSKTLWDDAVQPRLGGSDIGGFVEAVQGQLLDRFLPLAIELIIEAPEFDDATPKFDAASKSVSVPLRNSERRDILGLEPFGKDVLNPATGIPYDDEVYLPATSVMAFIAPSDGQKVKLPEPEPVVVAADAGKVAGETSDPSAVASRGVPGTKADIHPRFQPLHTSLTKLRANLDAKMTPRVRDAVMTFLHGQRSDIAARVRKNADHIAAHPGDTSIWFPAGSYNQKLETVLRGHLTGVADAVDTHIKTVLPAQKAASMAAPAAVERTLRRGAARVAKINETTRQAIAELIAQTLANDGTILDAADAIEEVTSAGGVALFDEYRSEMIARTEIMDAYNTAALGSYTEAGVEMVQAIDGDGDPECAERDGQVMSIDDADAIEDHPNGTLDWVPVVTFDEPQKATVAPAIVINNPGPLVREIVERDPVTNRVIGSYQVPI